MLTADGLNMFVIASLILSVIGGYAVTVGQIWFNEVGIWWRTDSPAVSEQELVERLKGRGSWSRRRRRHAYAACVRLIEMRRADLDRPDPIGCGCGGHITCPDCRRAVTADVEAALRESMTRPLREDHPNLIVGGCGMISSAYVRIPPRERERAATGDPSPPVKPALRTQQAR